MKLCQDCGQPITRGSSGRNKTCARCIVCATAHVLATFRYPASAEGQRAWRKGKGR